MIVRSLESDRHNQTGSPSGSNSFPPEELCLRVEAYAYSRRKLQIHRRVIPVSSSCVANKKRCLFVQLQRTGTITSCHNRLLQPGPHAGGWLAKSPWGGSAPTQCHAANHRHSYLRPERPDTAQQSQAVRETGRSKQRWPHAAKSSTHRRHRRVTRSFCGDTTRGCSLVLAQAPAVHQKTMAPRSRLGKCTSTTQRTPRPQCGRTSFPTPS